MPHREFGVLLQSRDVPASFVQLPLTSTSAAYLLPFSTYSTHVPVKSTSLLHLFFLLLLHVESTSYHHLFCTITPPACRFPCIFIIVYSSFIALPTNCTALPSPSPWPQCLHPSFQSTYSATSVASELMTLACFFSLRRSVHLFHTHSQISTCTSVCSLAVCRHSVLH
ncbi:hypothetical protein BDQ17DRAFT_1354170 [Cyathus striatus]|nr:hypothetical protein BDQ17DRAFT_1354170 [Cyathus striatus]